jgi:nucleotide-binding universal stress UspA family protein
MIVLMATDGSKHATTAMRSASRLLRKTNLHVDVLSVTPELVVSAAHCDSRDSYARHATQRNRDILAGARQILLGENIRANTIAEYGSAADRILQRASEYDLMVLGAYGRGERPQPGLGPVVSRVIQNGRRTLFIGRELVNEKNYRVLVALDGSEASLRALQSLHALFDVANFDITLMHVIETPWAQFQLGEWPAPGEEVSDISQYQRELMREFRSRGDRIIDDARDLVTSWGSSATTIIEEGDPALELTSHAEEGGYDVVVAGSAGTTDMKHAVLGSVSLKLAWDAPCSVLISNS